MACKRCGSVYVVNKKYELCDDCNFVRLHGVTRFVAELRKAKDIMKEERKYGRANKKRVDRSISELTKRKRKEQVKKDHETYLEVFKAKPSICEECGTPLPDEFYSDEVDFCANEKQINCIGQYSHILSKAAYPEFRNDARNFNRLCPNLCHNRWEFHDKENMGIYQNNQIIIQQLLDERNAKTFDRRK